MCVSVCGVLCRWYRSETLRLYVWVYRQVYSVCVSIYKGVYKAVYEGIYEGVYVVFAGNAAI